MPSPVAFSVAKYVGAAYLIHLGVQAMRTPVPDRTVPGTSMTPLGRVFRDGLVVALLNPKTAMFFAAFLPQSVDAPAAPLAQSLTLGGIFVAMAAVTDTVYALGAGTLAPALTRARATRRLGRYVTGGAFIGLGVFTAVAGSGSAK